MAGRTTRAGYGSAHQKLRAKLRLIVNRGEAYCARCGGWIAPEGEPCARPGCGKPTRKGGEAGKGFCGWDVGHDDRDRSRYNGPVPTEHTCCNRSTMGRRRVDLLRQVVDGPQGKRRADWY